jgi:hypothetical protein
MFLQNDRGLGVKNGTLGTIERISMQVMTVRTDDGRSVAFDLKHYDRIDHGPAATIHKAQGMTVDRTLARPCLRVLSGPEPSKTTSRSQTSHATTRPYHPPETVVSRTGLSRSTIYRKIAEGTFPAPAQDQDPRCCLARGRHRPLGRQPVSLAAGT